MNSDAIRDGVVPAQANRQFDDVHVFTLETKAWSQPESASGEENFGPPRWNFTAVSVFAVPFWKIFLFGGADSASSSNLNLTRSRRERFRDCMIPRRQLWRLGRWQAYR